MAIRTLLMSLFLFALVAGCPAGGGGGVAGDACETDDDCSGDLHCHLETGETAGECEDEEHSD